MKEQRKEENIKENIVEKKNLIAQDTRAEEEIKTQILITQIITQI